MKEVEVPDTQKLGFIEKERELVMFGESEIENLNSCCR